MSDIKPNVFPNNQPQQTTNLTEAERIAAYEAEKAMVTNEIYTSQISEETPQAHNGALEAMRARTEAQLNMKNSMGVVKDPSLSEKGSVYKQPTKEEQYQENQISLRDEQLRKNQEQTANYQRLSEDATTRGV